MIDPTDAAYMQMAYGLAEKAIGRASPNPCVGAVIVKDDAVAGYGHHEGPGRPHAEIVALARAGGRARGGTLYVTLEPCVHWGRTPPCVDAVLSAGFKRVVISALDPNPRVHRKGLNRLLRAGIAVDIGLFEERNRRLNQAHAKFITRGLPFVTLKAAVSLDGRMATRTFDSQWISSAEARSYVHLVRGEHDALLTGIGTVLRDDPLLTVRHPNWPGKRLVRAILDTTLRLPLRARLLSTEAEGRILVFAGDGAPRRKKEALLERGIEVHEVPVAAGGVSLPAVLASLGRLEIAGVLVEGGGRVTTAVLEGRLADKALLTLSPRFIGGNDAVPVFGGTGIASLRDALALTSMTVFRIGDETVLEGDF